MVVATQLNIRQRASPRSALERGMIFDARRSREPQSGFIRAATATRLDPKENRSRLTSEKRWCLAHDVWAGIRLVDARHTQEPSRAATRAVVLCGIDCYRLEGSGALLQYVQYGLEVRGRGEARPLRQSQALLDRVSSKSCSRKPEAITRPTVAPPGRGTNFRQASLLPRSSGRERNTSSGTRCLGPWALASDGGSGVTESAGAGPTSGRQHAERFADPSCSRPVVRDARPARIGLRCWTWSLTWSRSRSGRPGCRSSTPRCKHL